MSYTLIFYTKSDIVYDDYKSSFFHFETFSSKNELIEVLGKLIYENEYPDEYHILSLDEKNSEISSDEKMILWVNLLRLKII